jgi:hypothetical protein
MFGCSRLEFSPVLIDGIVPSAGTPISQAALDTQQQQQQQQQQVPLPSAVSACYEDALAEYYDSGAATDQQQQVRRQRRVSWQHDVAPSARDCSVGAAARGSSSNHSCSTHASGTSAFQSACSVLSPDD